jgi:hypothetical protein
MEFEAGTRLGRYEIRSPLGKGGMGHLDNAAGREQSAAVDFQCRLEPLADGLDRRSLHRLCLRPDRDRSHLAYQS